MNINALVNHHCPYCDEPLKEINVLQCPSCDATDFTWLVINHELLASRMNRVCVKSSEVDRAKRLIPEMLDMRLRNDRNAYSTPESGEHFRRIDDERSGIAWWLFSMDGRIGRLKYLLGHLLFHLIAAFPVAILIQAHEDSSNAIVIALLIYAVFNLASAVSLKVKRLHDLDLNGAWFLLLVIPLANIILELMCLFAPGKNTDGIYNRFGRDPRMNR